MYGGNILHYTLISVGPKELICIEVSWLLFFFFLNFSIKFCSIEMKKQDLGKAGRIVNYFYHFRCLRDRKGSDLKKFGPLSSLKSC